MSDNALLRIARLLSACPSLEALPLTRVGGEVTAVLAGQISVGGLSDHAGFGSVVEIDGGHGRSLGEIIGIRQNSATIKQFTGSSRLGLGDSVWVRHDLAIRPSDAWLGRVVNALGEPIDGKGELVDGRRYYPLEREPLAPMAIDRVRRPCATGVTAIDLFTPICLGQRIGIFAGSGIGKSTLLSMLMRASTFKTVVVALVAERAREVREFIEDSIEPSGASAITVVATSSESAMMRRLAAKTAMSLAEYFRDLGEDVLLIVDSLTRYAHALREVALAAGEPPVARGYAPSVFSDLPRLIERAGPGAMSGGSITAVFSVLVDGDDHNEPVADTVRGLLDGHIVLDRAISEQGRYPAINPLTSISRLAKLVWSREQSRLVRDVRALIARYEETRELRAVGAYKAGTDLELDRAVAAVPPLYDLLNQLPADQPCRNAFDYLAALPGLAGSQRAS